jgi:hypothetical protein
MINGSLTEGPEQQGAIGVLGDDFFLAEAAQELHELCLGYCCKRTAWPA